MECVKLGIIGIGTMGSVHAQNIMEGKIARCKLTAVCDPKPERLKPFSSADAFHSVEDFLRSSETDAVLIATPHYSHRIFGMPATVRASCHFGRYHDIEVEDDVTAYLEYSDGMTVVFTASTGEAPGTNRLEVAAERGKVVIENDRADWLLYPKEAKNR